MRFIDYVPIVVAVLYLLCAIGYLKEKQVGFSFTYFAYALANVGLVFAALGK